MSIIALEGCDGAGKNTQAKKLAAHLNAKLFSFPDYETETGQAILGNLQQRWAAAELDSSTLHTPRSFHLTGLPHRLNALALQSLFTINRYEVAAKVAAAALAGHVVLDRYWLSGVVYGTCDGLDEDWLIRIHERLPQPDVWILLDVPPEASVQRRPERRDRYESDGNMGKRRELYRTLWADRQGDTASRVDVSDTGFCYIVGRTVLSSKWILVDGTETVGAVHNTIVQHLAARGIR